MRPLALFLLFVTSVLSAAAAPPLKTRNVIFVSLDGLRWQEVFRGPEEALLNKENGGIPAASVNEVRKRWWKATPEERRAELMPFVWGEIAKNGQLYGNRDKGGDAHVANSRNISYPGYSEFLCGFADDERIMDNEPIPNPNVTVLEWLNGRAAFKGKVAACNCWGVLPFILNRDRSKLPMWMPGETTPASERGPVQTFVEQTVAQMTKPWSNGHFDVFVYETAREWLNLRKPRVFYVNFGEPDEWCHAGRYDHYLTSVRNADGFVRGLWEAAQSIPEFSGTTTLIVSPDHGRGAGLSNWKSHGPSIPEARETWLGVLGPDTPVLGERVEHSPVTQSQIPATIAALLGEDYCAAAPRAASPVADALPKP